MKKENSFSIDKRRKSFAYAFNGLAYAFKTQHNLWIHTAATAIVVAGGIILDISTPEWMMITFAIGFVISTEVVNTAIEKIVDFISPEQNKMAGLIKDIAAGAVLISSITAAIIGCLVFIPKFI